MAHGANEDNQAGVGSRIEARERPHSRLVPARTEWNVEVSFVGDCPLRARQIPVLTRLDNPSGRVRFTNISALRFDARSVGARARGPHEA